jgi:hypothetical protein
MNTYKIELGDRSICVAVPVIGNWYAGVEARTGRTGAVAKYIGDAFLNSDGEVNMRTYEVIRALSPLESLLVQENEDAEVGYGDKLEEDQKAVKLALQWLDTLIKSPGVVWVPAQKEAAQQSLAKARATLV